MVLSEGQAYSFEPKAEKRAPKPLAVQYLGFQNVGAWREYRLQVGRGDDAIRYVVSIELAAFSLRLALLQEGPDICYQMLVRALAGSERPVAETIMVTEADLAAYRAAHSVPARRRSFSAPLPTAPAAGKA